MCSVGSHKTYYEMYWNSIKWLSLACNVSRLCIDITQLSEAEKKLKLKYYTFKSFTVQVGNVFEIFAIHYFESQVFDTRCKTGL